MKKNKQKKLNGRPLKFSSSQALQSAIESYFDKQGQLPYTISGLCLHLEINLDTFYECEHNKEKGFSEIIKKARLKIMERSEQQLYGNHCVGAIFHLKNIGRKWFNDKYEVDNNIASNEPLIVKIVESKR